MSLCSALDGTFILHLVRDWNCSRFYKLVIIKPLSPEDYTIKFTCMSSEWKSLQIWGCKLWLVIKLFTIYNDWLKWKSFSEKRLNCLMMFQNTEPRSKQQLYFICPIIFSDNVQCICYYENKWVWVVDADLRNHKLKHFESKFFWWCFNCKIQCVKIWSFQWVKILGYNYTPLPSYCLLC